MKIALVRHQFTIEKLQTLNVTFSRFILFLQVIFIHTTLYGLKFYLFKQSMRTRIKSFPTDSTVKLV